MSKIFVKPIYTPVRWRSMDESTKKESVVHRIGDLSLLTCRWLADAAAGNLISRSSGESAAAKPPPYLLKSKIDILSWNAGSPLSDLHWQSIKGKSTSSRSHSWRSWAAWRSLDLIVCVSFCGASVGDQRNTSASAPMEMVIATGQGLFCTGHYLH